jgi:protoheme IX farnesyltransferase
MITESMTAAPVARPYPSRSYALLADYWALTKPDINFLIAIATFAGFYLGYPGGSDPFPILLLIHTLVGTMLVAAGTGALNQYMERRFDSEMRRTARRPIASGRVNPSSALWFGIVLSVAGSTYLAIAVNTLASLLAILTLLSYLFVYTPLKRLTPLCTTVGALPGAMPPLIGWAAAHGSLSPGAWVLYLVIFLWQFPHFMAIAWMYREDYQRAGYQVLPGGQARVRFVVLQTALPLLALILVSIVARPFGDRGLFDSVGALLIGLGFLYYGFRFVVRRTNTDARKLLVASIVYLPLLLVLMMRARA